jgi:predicted DNA-binding transcriptional regulator AlpA
MQPPETAIASLPMPEEIVTLASLAELLGCDRVTAWRYTNREDFPLPMAELPTGKVWETSKVEKWAARTLPLPPGRPPKRKRGNRN